MRIVILNEQNKFHGIIMSNLPDNFVGIAVDATEEQIKDILTHYNTEYNVFYDEITNDFTFSVNMNAVKERLRKIRDKDLARSDIYMLVDVYNALTAERQAEIAQYRTDLRDYINLIVVPSDEVDVPYPDKPSWV